MKTWLKDHYYMYTDIMMYASIGLIILELMPNAAMVYVSGGPTTAIPVSFPYYSLYLSSYGVVSYFLMFIATCILLRFDRRRRLYLEESDWYLFWSAFIVVLQTIDWVFWIHSGHMNITVINVAVFVAVIVKIGAFVTMRYIKKSDVQE